MNDKRGRRNGPKAVESKRLHSWLARYLIQHKDGERLRGVRDLAVKAETSTGSISSALNYLESVGAVAVERHGHAGSIVAKRWIGELWRIAEGSPLVIAWTLPTHLRFEALATGFKKVLTGMGISTYFIFVRGAKTRLELLRENKCHATVMSAYSANELCGPGESVLLKLPPRSWVLDYSVFYSTRPSQRERLRVAIDPTSFDHAQLTTLEFEGQDVDFMPVSYMQMPRLLKTDYIDVAVASLDQLEVFHSPLIEYRPLSERVTNMIGERGEAALVGLTPNPTVRAVVEALDVAQILEIQRQVLTSEMIPEY